MKISDAGIKLIKQFEGVRLTAYRDAVGVWTIGYGHTSGVIQGMKITDTQAESFLRSDLASAEKSVSKYDPVYKFNQNQFDALVSFTFNCGAGNLNKLVANGQRSTAQISEKLLSYNKAGGKVLAGLTRRRAAEKALFDKRTTAKKYSGILPSLPERGYFEKGDGYLTNTGIKEDIKNLQKFLNWCLGSKLNEDGKYGPDTQSVVKEYETRYGLKVDGAFGSKCLEKAKKIKQ